MLGYRGMVRSIVEGIKVSKKPIRRWAEEEEGRRLRLRYGPIGNPEKAHHPFWNVTIGIREHVVTSTVKSELRTSRKQYLPMLRVLGNGCVNAIHPAPFDELPVIDRLIELHGLTPFIIQSMSRRWVCQEATQSFFGHPIRGMCGNVKLTLHCGGSE